jgi:uroporphyrin-III C-methyltransferase
MTTSLLGVTIVSAQTQTNVATTGVARGVTLVTAHTQDGSSLNWQALAQGGTTLVIYMGVAKLSEIREQLLAGGMAADMPVAMIENASLPHQRECRSDLTAMEEDACAFELKSPAILVIGTVAGPDHCRSELARDEPENIAGCHSGSVIVDDHRRNAARS